MKKFVPADKADRREMERLAETGKAEHTLTPDEKGGGWWVELADDPRGPAQRAKEGGCSNCGEGFSG
jgi:hypothetical protein